MSESADHPRNRLGDRAALYVDALQRFVAAEAITMTPPTRARYGRVLTHLLHYLDTVDVERWLGTGPAALLSSEREFARENAFFRVFDFDELVACLPGFLEPAWLLPKRGDARSQIRLTERLLKRLRRDRLIDMPIVACAYLEAEAAVDQARRYLAGHLVWEHEWPDDSPSLRVIRGAHGDIDEPE